MAAGAQPHTWDGSSRRSSPRFPLHAQLDVTVWRSGIPDTLPGRSLNVCERGVAAVLAGELVPGEAVSLELHLPPFPEAIKTRAIVRYRDSLCCGFEFSGLSAEQCSMIRGWAKETRAGTEVLGSPSMKKQQSEPKTRKGSEASAEASQPAPPQDSRRGLNWAVFFVVTAIVAGLLWWKWNRDWDELETGLKSGDTASAAKPQVQVPAEVMEKLLVHRVEPVYPEAAKRDKLQGIIALDIVVGRDGSVIGMHALNGPDVLARAAMDALRWWKFTPYRMNGEPAIIETTVAVEFKRGSGPVPGSRPPEPH